MNQPRDLIEPRKLSTKCTSVSPWLFLECTLVMTVQCFAPSFLPHLVFDIPSDFKNIMVRFRVVASVFGRLERKWIFHSLRQTTCLFQLRVLSPRWINGRTSASGRIPAIFQISSSNWIISSIQSVCHSQNAFFEWIQNSVSAMDFWTSYELPKLDRKVILHRLSPATPPVG